jgi:hypothetical protein
MRKDQPLSIRLYLHEPLYALARIVGYGGLPVPEVRERARPLLEKYGKETMNRAAGELVDFDTSTDPPTARLKGPVRRLCRQLLGPPPGEDERQRESA